MLNELALLSVSKFEVERSEEHHWYWIQDLQDLNTGLTGLEYMTYRTWIQDLQDLNTGLTGLEYRTYRTYKTWIQDIKSLWGHSLWTKLTCNIPMNSELTINSNLYNSYNFYHYTLRGCNILRETILFTNDSFTILCGWPIYYIHWTDSITYKL